MEVKLTEFKANVFLLTLLVFLDMEPFFVWNAFSPIGYRIYTTVILISTAFMAYKIFIKKIVVAGMVPDLTDTTRLRLSLVFASSLIVVLLLYQFFLSGVVTVTQQPVNMAMLCIHLGLMLFALQDCITLRRVFLLTKTVFAISLIPAILVFLLIQIGVYPPSVSIAAGEGVVAEARTYDLFLGVAVMIRSLGVTLLNRLCGVFLEPGFVGTMGVFFLLGDKMTLKKWQNIVILIACAFTFSLAFVLLLLSGILLRLVGNLKNKTTFLLSIILIFALIVGYFVFMSLPLDENTMLGELQARMEITDEGLAGDNRFGSSVWAVDAYEDFLKRDWKTRLFGYGQDPRLIPGTEVSIWMYVHSYKEYIFGFGFIGFGLLLLALVYTFGEKFWRNAAGRKWSIFVLLAVFLISIYQRYMVANFHYYCVLFGGAANLALMDDEKADEPRRKGKKVVLKWGS